MFHLRLKSTTFASLACLVLLLGLLGCESHSGPVAVSVPAAGEAILNPDFVRILPANEGEPYIHLSSSSSVVSAQLGGEVTNGRVTLMFPPGALNEDTEITVVMDPTGLYIADLGPEGIYFNVPITMSFDLVGTTSEGKAAITYIAWYNDMLGQWEMTENLPPPDENTIRSLLQHFSKYAGVGG